MEWIYKRIWELKAKALTKENKQRIQMLQQMLDNDSTKKSASEKGDKINSANNNSSSKEEEEIHNFLFNRYNR
jgi:hypothetical protein